MFDITDEGQLGVGHTNDIGDGDNEMGDYLAITDLGTNSFPVSLSCGAFHCCAIVVNGGTALSQ